MECITLGNGNGDAYKENLRSRDRFPDFKQDIKRRISRESLGHSLASAGYIDRDIGFLWGQIESSSPELTHLESGSFSALPIKEVRLITEINVRDLVISLCGVVSGMGMFFIGLIINPILCVFGIGCLTLGLFHLAWAEK